MAKPIAKPKTGWLTLRARELLKAARAEPGVKQWSDLRKGARITVRAADGQIWMTFSRPDVPVGEDEIATFIRDCEVPYGAQRLPAEGQGAGDDRGRTRYYVTYRWADNAQLDL